MSKIKYWICTAIESFPIDPEKKEKLRKKLLEKKQEKGGSRK